MELIDTTMAESLFRIEDTHNVTENSCITRNFQEEIPNNDEHIMQPIGNIHCIPQDTHEQTEQSIHTIMNLLQRRYENLRRIMRLMSVHFQCPPEFVPANNSECFQHLSRLYNMMEEFIVDRAGKYPNYILPGRLLCACIYINNLHKITTARRKESINALNHLTR